MNKYYYKFTTSIFQAPKEAEYDEVQHKILNEHIKDIEIIVIAEEASQAGNKMQLRLKEIIEWQFKNDPSVRHYKFNTKLFKIEEI